MELGTWSDWFEAVGELLAVVVALFLPVYQERKQQRLTRQRVSRNVQRLTVSLLGTTRNSATWEADFHTLKTILQLYRALLTDDRGASIVALGEQLVIAVAEPVPDQPTISKLLAQLEACK
ncbi:hypothetical protein ACFQ44_09675 [Levilactobacillus lanxiensis]|uniref:Uncharacterized protein n=1 Tax=Levilactobacillus lanxiensis TaxID=2799568 RepID=A0ABW4D6Y6_9LACO|nr:hypothetical protein [Levilactobacillus lanxiensis]